MQDPKNITMGKTIFVTGPRQQTKPEDVINQKKSKKPGSTVKQDHRSTVYAGPKKYNHG